MSGGRPPTNTWREYVPCTASFDGRLPSGQLRNRCRCALLPSPVLRAGGSADGSASERFSDDPMTLLSESAHDVCRIGVELPIAASRSCDRGGAAQPEDHD